MQAIQNFPRQKLSYSQKTKSWRKSVLDWADNKSYFHNQSTRKNFWNKKINSDLYHGKVDVRDMKLILNPSEINASFIPDNIQHYPIASPKIDALVGEELKRRFDFKIVVSNPNAISQKEEQKKQEAIQKLTSIIQAASANQEDNKAKLEKLKYYLQYEWQDMRELRANYLVNHYFKELELKKTLNKGWKNALLFGEEAYIITAVQGEPFIETLNPRKLHVLRNGYSTKIEDCDIAIYDDMWSPGRIIDTYFDQLSAKDIEWLEQYPNNNASDEMYNYDERDNFIWKGAVDNELNGVDDFVFMFGQSGSTFNNYYDAYGNVRVLRVWWKSRRKVLKVKSYDPVDGTTVYNYYPETYVPNKSKGEEAEPYWINEAWTGCKIGKNIYVDMKPMEIQFNRISNPSRCHFGIIGEIYSTNEAKAQSLFDRMKPYQYLYDAVHDKLCALLAANYGKIAEVDIAKIPDKWEPDKWLYYANKFKIAWVNSFNEGNKGAATGKLAGGFNAIGGRTLDLDQGNAIQYHIQLLQWIESQMATLSGISKQREGNIQASETLGGIERAITSSSNITEELFMRHDSVKARLLGALIEVAKITLKGNKKKMQYILDDGSMNIFDIDGDEFSEADYGIVVDNSFSNIELMQKLDNLSHAAMQNQTLSFSTLMSIYTDPSMSSIRRKIEADERSRMEQQAQQAKMQDEQMQRDLQEKARQFELMQAWEKEKFYVSENNDLLIAGMKTEEGDNTLEERKLDQKREAEDKKLDVQKEALKLDEKKHSDTMELKHKDLIKKYQQRQNKK